MIALFICHLALSRTFLYQQLSQWETQRVLGPQNISQEVHQFLIEDDRLKLYMLLAGEMIWGGGRVNVCQGLDWKRVLAIHLCYCCPPSAPIRDVLNNYYEAFAVSFNGDICFHGNMLLIV